MIDASVMLWGREIAAVSWLEDRELGVFQYAPEFLSSGIEVAPFTMPLRAASYEFPALPREAFKGLPGLLADCLPDKFGNALINSWLARQQRTPESFNSLERLCYTGSRSIGALEFKPSRHKELGKSQSLEIAQLTELANRALESRQSLMGEFDGQNDGKALEDIIRVGTSAGGARAKAVLAWNETTGEFRSGQVSNQEGFSDWILKFDGVAENSDKEIADPKGYGLIEYAYSNMAKAAGITMTECRLHQEGGRSHFMTKRFDRTATGEKLHMQSLAGLMHYDFNQAGAYSYEQALQVIRRLKLPMAALNEQYRRAVFNVLARNQDDHVKNIAYLMNKAGEWSLSPAFDLVYSYNPSGAWTSRHQMSLNGKRESFTQEDLLSLAHAASIKPAAAKKIIGQVAEALLHWHDFAKAAGVSLKAAEQIAATHRVF